MPPAPEKRGVSFLQFLNTAAIFALLGGVGYLAFTAAKSKIAADIYQQKLAAVAADYQQVRGLYNQAVTKTAVTELVVSGKSLVVRIRTAAGVIKEIPTPFDPAQEIYIDYAVLDGRLWIRRVFDAKTPPNQGLVIDPALADIKWPAENVAVGKAVYRSLTDGRWVVTVSGDGSLGLGKVDNVPDLTSAPIIREHNTITDDASREAGSITPGDVWRWMAK